MSYDVLGSPYSVTTLPLPDDDEGEVVATLVRGPATGQARGAVLHVHGFADYFFQRDYGDWWRSRGYDFYGLDLRKYGRSLRAHQTPNYVQDLSQYTPELDLAMAHIHGDGHRHVVGSGHSAGGLTLPLWAADTQTDLAGMFLNSPFLDLRGSAFMRTIGTEVIKRLSSFAPLTPVPREVNGNYAKSLHVDYEGEFDFNLDWKPLDSFPATVGWLAAIRRGHSRLHEGLDLAHPILVGHSDRTGVGDVLDENTHTRDIVLDVDQIHQWAPSLGRNVTIATIAGARHDLVLSRPEPRAQTYDILGRWHDAFVAPLP